MEVRPVSSSETNSRLLGDWLSVAMDGILIRRQRLHSAFGERGSQSQSLASERLAGPGDDPRGNPHPPAAWGPVENQRSKQPEAGFGATDPLSRPERPPVLALVPGITIR